jgi:hypothetical protein
MTTPEDVKKKVAEIKSKLLAGLDASIEKLSKESDQYDLPFWIKKLETADKDYLEKVANFPPLESSRVS